MISTYQIDATNGDHLIPYTSHAMDRLVSISYHQTPTAGTIDVMARPFGRTDFIAVDGAAAIPATAEKSFTVSYPMAEFKFTLTGVTGGTMVNITIAEGVA